MKKIVLVGIFTFFSMLTFAQSGSVSGTVKDTSENKVIPLAAVAVLNMGDSILQGYTRTDDKGAFTINNLKDGDYILLITYPKYGDMVDYFMIQDGEHQNLDAISLTQTAKLLEEIVIQQPSMVIKGDTTEYNASMFKVRENASAEDLLKELPGIQVNSDGTIIAQGQQVEKVLVDGDEFFSDDPTVATKNLRADAIAKVQVYDKRSDQAAFTGIDDGQEQRTIDFKLKESAKKGYFGKASAAGLDKYYNATGMLNSFKSKRQLSVYGVASSTNQTGLSGDDMGAIGIGGGGRGGMRSMGGGGGQFGGQGLPESINAGAHYSNKWNENKNSAGGNYRYSDLKTRSNSNTFSQNTLLDSVYYSRNTSTSQNSNIRHNVDGVMELQLDSTSQITVRANGNTGTSNNFSTTTSENNSEEHIPVNSSERTNSTKTDNDNFNTNIFYRKRFKKPGRTISANFSQNYGNNRSNGLLNDVSKFYDLDGNQIRQDNIDQNKVNKTINQTLQGKITYTNPITANSYLEFDYTFNHNSNDQEKLSFNKDGSGKYDELVDSLSSNYLYRYNTHTGGMNYLINGQKTTLNFGGSISRTGVEQEDKFNHSNRDYSYVNFFPQANFQYKISSFSSLRFNYNGRTSQPTIDQLQPLNDNSDPMNIIVGNPDLKQSFTNSFGLNFNNFQMLSEKYTFIRLNFSTTSNQINSSYVIDNLGRRVTKYVNISGNYNLGFSGNYSQKLGATWRVSVGPGVNLSQTKNFINEVENATKTLTLSPSVSFSKRDVEKYDFNLGYSPSFNSSRSSVSSTSDLNYWIQSFNFNGRYTLPFKLDLVSSLNFENRQKIDQDDNQNQVILWNASVEKRFLSREQLTLSFSIHDILNQNKGYSRVINPNAIVESNYLTFQRYGLITLTYNFNTTGTGGSSSGGGAARGGGGRRFGR